MASRRFPAPASASDAARRFIDTAPPIEKLDTTLEILQAKRRESFETYAPPGRAVLKELDATVEAGRVASVPVEWVAPRKVRHPGIILYFFGGGHVMGSPAEDLAITARLAHYAGRKLCAVDYRLAPEHPYPAALEDALAVYQALLETHGARSLAVSGESAGGNLSLALIHAAAAKKLPLPAAAGLLSPWCDLTHSGDTIATLQGADPTLDAELNVGPMARAYAGKNPASLPGISPLLADVPKGFPPTIITTGTRDLLLSDCARLATKLRAAGVEADLRVFEGMWHVFEYYPDLPESEVSLKEIAAFLDKQLSAAVRS